ncbi:hypothetical protein GJ688_10485 [Heliobacillus mobilis]|uniref:Uncharacterized protein n=1 Tax=Heliobacterium mobile TaxID=28064 RepID=A0A6I3SKE3_HELMO|nr:hypothetical protein [Heliobacterium mobile]MTV49404.1 hypothetical protein [Heliobacterium mobile]
MSTEGLEKLAKQEIQFISRLPETFNLAETLKKEALEANQWSHHGELACSDKKEKTIYKTYATQGEIEGRFYDFVVVHSSALDAKKEKTVDKRIFTQEKKLTKDAKELAQKAFVCAADAEKA